MTQYRAFHKCEECGESIFMFVIAWSLPMSSQPPLGQEILQELRKCKSVYFDIREAHYLITCPSCGEATAIIDTINIKYEKIKEGSHAGTQDMH
jgi:hypothetical protein